MLRGSPEHKKKIERGRKIDAMQGVDRKTPGGLDKMEVISALQKHIRRGEEEKAMMMAVEMVAIDKNYLWNRLRVISMEDIGIAEPLAMILIPQLHQNFDLFWCQQRESPCKLVLANAILFLCRAKKTRLADHFQAHVVSEMKKGVSIEEWTLDQHTRRGRHLRRGLKYFKKVSTKLYGKDEDIIDPYEKSAYKAWEKRTTDIGWFKR